MIFRQITHDDLGCASYLIGDEKAGVAAVVDPRFEVEEYLELARYMGVSIEHVFETHNHADHVSGHGRLAAATGAAIHIHCLAGATYAHEPFDDSNEWELGALKVRALHTPGHRPEHVAFALDRHQPRRPALGGAHRRQPVRQRRGQARPRHRQGRRRPRYFSLVAGAAVEPARRRRDLAGTPRRLHVRRAGDGHEGLLDHRLREAVQPDPLDRRRGGVRRAGAGQARPPAAELRGDRRAQSRASAHRRRGAAARSRRARSTRSETRARCSSTSGPTSSSTTPISPVRSASP